MDQIETLNRYLISAARERGPGAGPAKRGVLPFITISRESGAGGRALAETLLEAFGKRGDDDLFAGWQIFDRELCEHVASDPGLHVRVRELLDEYTLNAVEDMVSVMLGRSPQRQIYRKVNETIRELALVGKAIIVGRGGSCTTRDLATGIHLRLVAPQAVRIERETRLRGNEVGDVARWVREQDRNRADLVKRMAGRKIDDPLLYDAIWNTERAPLDAIASSVVDWVERLRPA